MWENRVGFMRQVFVGLVLVGTAALTIAGEPDPGAVALRKDGALIVRGKPVLPYGFYISTGHTGDMRLRCVELVHEIGGNIVHIEGPWHEDTRFLDRAAELGIHVVAGHTEHEDKLWRVKKYKDHPAIIAWTLYDDANTKSSVEHLTKMNKLIKEIVPNRLIYIPIGTQSRDVITPAEGFFNCTDFVGWENYPIACPGAADSSLRATETQMSAVQKLAAKAGRVVWILPQTFAWPGGRVPTPVEYRNLCYVGLINGAKGVMPWSIYYKGDSPEVTAKKKAAGKPAWTEWFLPDSKALWAECKAVASELNHLAPMLLDDEYHKLTDGGDVTAAIWTSKNGSLVIVANLVEKESRKVLLPLPRKTGDEWAPVFPNRVAGLNLTDGKITGEIGPAEVQVYRVVNR
jgi:hypothetical protein